MNSNNDIIQIKGLQDGLLITLGAGRWQELKELLLVQIDERTAFFHGARLALDVGNQDLRVAELSKFRDDLSVREISLWAVLSESPKTVQTAQLLGLATRISKPRRTGKPLPIVDAGNKEAALWIQRTLRSGTRIENLGHVVVVGDINSGAEIVAGGNVLVWGRLRGSVHAGAGLRTEADSNPGAFICALEMNPTKIQIASKIANPTEVRESKSPQKISLKDSRIFVEAWRRK